MVLKIVSALLVTFVMIGLVSPISHAQDIQAAPLMISDALPNDMMIHRTILQGQSYSLMFVNRKIYKKGDIFLSWSNNNNFSLSVCNSINSDVAQIEVGKLSTLTFGPIMSTKMACADSKKQELENKLSAWMSEGVQAKRVELVNKNSFRGVDEYLVFFKGKEFFIFKLEAEFME